MINLKATRVISMSYPDDRVDFKTIKYFIDRGMPIGNFTVVNNDCGVVENRNRIMLQHVFRLMETTEWFIFIDKDNYPTANTDVFLKDTEHDVVGCQYETGNPASWATSEHFHMGFVRVRSSIMKKLMAPWFVMSWNDDGTAIKECECNYFREKLLSVGAKITRMGSCGHETTHSWKSSTFCK